MPDLSALGANAVLGVSLALCRASAAAAGQPLYRRIAELAESPGPAMPCPMVNILSGGLHAGRGMDLQDFLAIPVSARSYSEALHMMDHTHYRIGCQHADNDPNDQLLILHNETLIQQYRTNVL